MEQMNANTTTSLALDTNELQKLGELPTDLTLQQAAPFLTHLVKDPPFLEVEILLLLEEARSTEEDWYVAHSYEGKDHCFSLQVFVWPPGTGTKIHDHSSWVVYRCAV
jgi:predicted metal-dependent enzyme (double-stranded beta helix superfamily)